MVRKVPTVAQTRGLVGFSNLGNTCYLNAAMQALVHTRLLRDYFLQVDYAFDINPQTRFGLQGQMAVAFAQLLEQVWVEPSATCTAPRRIKALAAQSNADFEGFAQHDAHELLECVLNTLNEELNRNPSKPYI